MALDPGRLNDFQNKIKTQGIGAVPGYYDYLAANGIEYGSLASQVGGEGFFGDVAENYFYNKVREMHPGQSDAWINAKFNAIRADLAQADIAARLESISKGQGGEIPYKTIYDYHHKEYSDNGISPTAWTGKVFDDLYGIYGSYMEGFDPSIILSADNLIISGVQGLFDLIRNPSGFENKFGGIFDVMEAIADSIDSGGDFLKFLGSLASITTYADEIIDGISDLVGEGSDLVKDVNEWLDQQFSDFENGFDDFVDQLREALGLFSGGPDDGGTGNGSWFGDLFGPEGPFGGLGDLARALGEDIADALSGALAAIAKLFDNLPSSPLVLDLDGDGIELISLPNTKAFFDIDSDGFAELTGWVKADDGLLARDLNNNGKIDNTTELFGSATTDGFIFLKQLDTNKNNKIDAGDTGFNSLRVWRDLDGDGVTDAGELKNLAQHGISSIDLNYTVVNQTLEGHRISSTSTFTQNGVSKAIKDVWFNHNQTVSLDILPTGFTYDKEVFLLPAFRGHGDVKHLWVSMTENPALKTAVKAILSADYKNFDLGKFQDTVETMLLKWTGAETINPTSRGTNIDARHLVAMEKFIGAKLSQEFPLFNAGAQLEKQWDQLVTEYAVKLMVLIPNKAMVDAYAKAFAFFESKFDAGVEPSNISQSEIDAKVTPLLKAGEAAFNAHPLKWIAQFEYNKITDRLDGSFEKFVSSLTAQETATNKAIYWAAKMPIVNAVADMQGVTDSQYSGILGGTYIGKTTDNPLSLRSAAIITGTSGADTIQTTGVGCYIVASGGDDHITLNANNSVLSYNLGDGYDRIVSMNSSDKIVFGTGISGSDLKVGTDYYGKAIITLSKGGGMTIDSALNASTSFGANVQFADGSVWTKATLYGKYVSSMNAATGDTIYAHGNTADVIGGKGDDTIYLMQDKTTLRYNVGDGNDTILAMKAQDKVVLGTGLTASGTKISTEYYGDYTLTFNQGGSIRIDGGSATVQFSDGTVWNKAAIHSKYMASMNAATSDTIYAHSNAVDIIAGKGDDTIYLMQDKSTVRYNVGDGHDMILAMKAADKVVLGSGIATTNVKVGTEYYGDYIVSFSQGGSVRIDGSHANVQFSDGTIWNKATLYSKYITSMNAATGDTIYAHTNAVDILGGKGDDTIYLMQDKSTVRYNVGDGNDVIIDMDALDKVILGSGIATSGTKISSEYYGDAILTFTQGGGIKIKGGMSGDANVQFSDGTVWNKATIYGKYIASLNAATSDTIFAHANTVDIIGGKGDDTIYLMQDKSTVRYNVGDGNDTLIGMHGADKLILGASITASGVKVTSEYYGDAVLTFSQGGSVNVDGGMNGNANVQFADGTVWNKATLYGKYIAAVQTTGNDTIYMHNNSLAVDANKGNDTVSGSSGNDSISGGEGDDRLIGYNGNDSLIGGLGKDFLQGGNGADIFRFTSKADSTTTAADTINDFRYGGADKIMLSGLGFTGIKAGAASGTVLGYVYDAASNDTIVSNGTFKILLDGNITLSSSDFVF